MMMAVWSNEDTEGLMITQEIDMTIDWYHHHHHKIDHRTEGSQFIMIMMIIIIIIIIVTIDMTDVIAMTELKQNTRSTGQGGHNSKTPFHRTGGSESPSTVGCSIVRSHMPVTSHRCRAALVSPIVTPIVTPTGKSALF